MTKKISKTIYYLRTYQDHASFDLENVLRSFFNYAPSVSASQINLLGDMIQIMSKNLSPTNSKNISVGGILLHIGKGAQDEHMRTMQNFTTEIVDVGGIQPPPMDHSFLRQEAFLYIKESHVIFCGHGFLKPNIISLYLNELSKKLNNNLTNFPLISIEFKAVADCNKLKLIKKHGVKSINIDTAAYKQSIDNINNSKSFLRKILEFIPSLSIDEKNDEQIKVQSEIQINLELKLNGNTYASEEAKKTMQKYAEELIDDEEIQDGFSIITQDGERIQASQVKLCKTTNISRYEKANSLLPSSAFSAIIDYFQELIDEKLTDQ